MLTMAAPRYFAASVFIIAIILCSNHGFNIDTTMPVIKRGAPGSYFGFSVSQHQIMNGDIISEHLLLIGAPKANVPELAVVRTGDVYKCNARSTNEQDCVRIQGPAEADNELDVNDREAAKTADGRRDQWLGNVVYSQGTGKKVVICGHRYRKKEKSLHYMIGKCILMEQELRNQTFVSPCSGKDMSTNSKDKTNNYRMCQAGTSSMITEDTNLMIGAPGSIIWTGQIYQQNKASGLGARILYSSPVVSGKAPVLPMSYLGYSLSAGKFDSDKTWRYVAGAPRSSLTGTVVVFSTGRTSTMTFHPNNIVRGEKDFSAFGHSLLAVDINNDGFDDLIIGSPFYYDDNVGGAIYIYLGGDHISEFPSESKKVKILSRKMTTDECEQLGCEHARFGFSLAKAGDVNKDGYEDIAVGAPYEGSGSVYIFHGSANGLVQEYAQRITAEDMPTNVPIHTFGYSLSGGIDLDGNGYPDIVTGAYSTDMAFLLRTRPIIHLISEVTLSPEKITYVADAVSNCKFDDVAQECVKIRICLKFTAEPVQRFTSPQEIVYRIDAESDKINKRVEFKEAADDTKTFVERSVILYRQSSNQHKCISEIAYLKKNVQDLLSAIDFTVTYSLADIKVPVPNPVILADINDYPILFLDGGDGKITKFQIEFQKDCGSNDVCESNLYMEVQNNLHKDTSDGMSELKKGIDSLIILDIIIRNTGEPAYATNFYLTIPAGLRWQIVDSINPVEKKYNCSIQDDGMLFCQNIGNPLIRDGELHFRHTLQVEDLKAADNNIVLTASVNTTSHEATPGGDIIETTIRVMTVADPYLHSASEPTTVFYQGEVIGASAVKYDTQIGPAVNHTYVVGNKGPGDVDNLRVTIFWPYEMESDYPHGKHLLYLMQPPVLQGPVTCLTEDIFNVLNVEKAPSYVDTDDSEEGPVYHAPAEETTSNLKRKKRETGRDSEPKIGEVKSKSSMILDCMKGNARCHKIHCDVSFLATADYAVITIVARLWKSTFLQDFRNEDAVDIYSRAILNVDPTLYIQNSTEDDAAEAITTAYPDIAVVEKEGIAWWIILIAAIGGLLLLVLLAIILWKLGFFKRKKRDEMKTYEARLEKKKDKDADA